MSKPAGPTDLRLSPAELAAWREIPTATISDEMKHVGGMAAEINPVTPGRRFAGQAVTIETIPKANPAPHYAIAEAWPGAVIVIDGRCYPNSAIWGGNLICAAAARGVAAVVVDGNVRDAADLRASGLCVYSRAIRPTGWDWGGNVNVPIECGGVPVSPGDLVVGDDDGVIVVPIGDRDGLMERCRTRIERDEKLQYELRSGRLGVDILKLPPIR
jgi:4-hydroxy-4-methyl-2-oxoglutarate aldolase